MTEHTAFTTTDEMTDQILTDLARARALFQARAIAAVLGAAPLESLTPTKPLPSAPEIKTMNHLDKIKEIRLLGRQAAGEMRQRHEKSRTPKNCFPPVLRPRPALNAWSTAKWTGLCANDGGFPAEPPPSAPEGE